MFGLQLRHRCSAVIITHVTTFVCMDIVFSDKDERILQVIFKLIGDYPDKLEYQKLNTTALCHIFNNRALSLDLLCIFGFEQYISRRNNSFLKFIGVARFISNRIFVEMMVRQGTIRFELMKCALRACFRADKDTRETFDRNSITMGVFVNTKYNFDEIAENVWEKAPVSEKIDAALEAKEMYNLKYIQDSWHSTWFSGMISLSISVFNNDGVYFENIDWNAMKMVKLEYGYGDNKQCCLPLMPNTKDKLYLNTFLQNVLTTVDKKKQTTNFGKKCIYFLTQSMRNAEKNNPIGISPHHNHHHHHHTHSCQKCHCNCGQLPMLRCQDESVIDHVKTNNHQCIERHTKLKNDCNFPRQDYIENIYKPNAMKLKDSKEICQKIQQEILSQDTNAKARWNWKCLVCNTFNEFSKFNKCCPTCAMNQLEISIDDYNYRLLSFSPLFCMDPDLNSSKSFCVDPRNKAFYIIRDKNIKIGEYTDEKICRKKYSLIQEWMENKCNLKSRLSQIIYHVRNGMSRNIALFIILFDKLKPLTLYQVKHILSELRIFISFDSCERKYWTFGGVFLPPGHNPHVFDKLNDDSVIDITQPMYIDSSRILVALLNGNNCSSGMVTSQLEEDEKEWDSLSEAEKEKRRYRRQYVHNFQPTIQQQAKFYIHSGILYYAVIV